MTDSRSALIAEVITDLSKPQKTLSPKFLYDARGSELFEQICDLPEYYPTRAEEEILNLQGRDIVEKMGETPVLIEFGSGDSRKTRRLLEHMAKGSTYVPIDISSDFLIQAAAQVAREYPSVRVVPLCADFNREIRFERLRSLPGPRTGLFAGSTIGNFEPKSAVHFIRRAGEILGENGDFLIGVDLAKSPDILVPAYDDAAGVTAQFNLNVLTHLNRELGANFNVDFFFHRARWNADESRIEMHLVSRRPQAVKIGDSTVHFAEGESILSECSYKYEVRRFEAIALEAGFEPDEVYLDSRGWYAFFRLKRRGMGQLTARTAA